MEAIGRLSALSAACTVFFGLLFFEEAMHPVDMIAVLL